MKKNRLLSYLLVAAMMIALLPIQAVAAWAPPAALGAPTQLAVTLSGDADELATGGRFGFEIGYSASAEARAFVDAIEEGGAFEEAGYDSAGLNIQIDYKLDDGAWHYAAAWDEHETPTDLDKGAGLAKGFYAASTNLAEYVFPDVFPDETMPGGISFFDTHTLHFRVRFFADWHSDADGNGKVISPWSEIVSFSNKSTKGDPAALINHTPTLSSVKLVKDADGKPVLRFTTAPAHADQKQLNADSTERLFTNVWVKVGSGAWQNSGTTMFFLEQFDVPASQFFPDDTDVAAAVFEVKFRYELDMSYYPGSTSNAVLYSPYSNILKQGTPAYSNASSWAVKEMDEAVAADLIPGILQGADMIQPITREEFAALAVRLYEKISGMAAEPVSPNPFKDTTNVEILKAVSVGITKGTGDGTTFSPKLLITREQCATMLFRTLKELRPDENYSITGLPDFPDQAKISSYAVEATKYMAKIGIVKGNAEGYFMPKSDTSVSTAANYGMATREAAVLMSVRSLKYVN